MNVYILFWHDYTPEGDMIPTIDKIFSTEEAAEEYKRNITKEYPSLKSLMKIEEYPVED